MAAFLAGGAFQAGGAQLLGPAVAAARDRLAAVEHLGAASVGGASCTSLPAWPTLQELQDAGFVLDVSAAEVVVGQVLAVGGGLVFLPQAVKIAWRWSVEGTSLTMVITNMMATCMQLAVIIADTSPTFLACRRMSFGRCLTNTLAFQQIAWQAAATTGLFFTYVVVWRLEPSARRRSAKASAASGLLVAVLAPAAFAVLPLCLGPCSASLPPMRDVAAGAASLLQALVMLPQIRLLCFTHGVGSLSLVSVAAQGLGSLAMAADMVVEQVHIVSILPFLVMAVECLLLLFLAACYGCREAARSRCASEAISLQRGLSSSGS